MANDNGTIIPFARGGTPTPEDAASPPRHEFVLARRRGLDTIEPIAPTATVTRNRPAQSGAAPSEKRLGVPELSSVFIASLDDLICKRAATASLAGRWPKQDDGQLEKVAIDIVDMLFGFVLEDPSIPRGIKEALLSAQLPVMQLAIREPVFFSDWQHPARRLLNEIAPLLRSYGELGGKADDFVDEFTAGMNRLLDELTPTGNGCAILLEHLQQFVVGTEQRLRDSRAGWQRAEAAARTLLERPLPQLARDFVAGYWIDVLEHLAATHDDDSPQWQDALAVVEDLAWSLAPKQGEDDRYRLIALIPALLTRLNRGLDLIDVASEDRRPFFDALVDIHGAVLRVETTAAPAPAPKSAAREETALEQVARLQRGDWVEIRLDDGSASRERLTWISPQRGILVFSNRQGQRAIQIAPEDLAELVRQRKAVLIFDQPSAALPRESA